MRKGFTNERLVEAFLTLHTDTQIAEETGLTRRTVSKYRHSEEFQKVLTERRTELLQDTVRKMQAGLDEAVETLQGIINNPDCSPQTRVNAIATLFSHCRAWTEAVDIMERLQRLEERMNGK